MSAEEAKKPVTTVKEFKESQKNDTSWKKPAWIGDDGYEYRVNRVKQEDGTYKVINVRIGGEPIAPPKEGK